MKKTNLLFGKLHQKRKLCCLYFQNHFSLNVWQVHSRHVSLTVRQFLKWMWISLARSDILVDSTLILIETVWMLSAMRKSYKLIQSLKTISCSVFSLWRSNYHWSLHTAAPDARSCGGKCRWCRCRSFQPTSIHSPWGKTCTKSFLL